MVLRLDCYKKGIKKIRKILQQALTENACCVILYEYATACITYKQSSALTLRQSGWQAFIFSVWMNMCRVHIICG